MSLNLEYFFHLNKIAFLVVYILVPCAIGDREPGWFKICNPEVGSLYPNHKVQAENCPHGVWLPKASSLDCICVNGLWALTNDWCDEDYQLVYGRGHCFNVDTKVRKISYLGDPQDPFGSKDFITTSQAHVFHPLTGADSLLAEQPNSTRKGITILRINPQNELTVKWKTKEDGQFDSVCFNKLGDLGKESHPLLIFSLPAPVTNIEVKEECSSENSQNGVVALKPGKLIAVRSGKIVSSSDKCSSACQRLGVHERTKRNSNGHKTKARSRRIEKLGRAAVLATTRKPKVRMSNFILIDLLESSSTKKPFDPRSRDNCSEFMLYPKDFFLLDEDKVQIVNEETRRAVRIETNLLLNGEKGPSVVNTTAQRHWVMLQHVKKVFLKACPEAQVPPFVVNSIMRIFRYIFIHTRDSNPYGMHFEDRAQDTRIVDALTKCFDEGQPLDFKYVTNQTDCRNETTKSTTQVVNSTTGATENVTTLTNVTICKCTTELGNLNITWPKLNTTTSTVDNVTFELNKTTLLLPDIQQHDIIKTNFTLGTHDFIVESIWKIINFAHFYCSNQFEANPTDHSALFNKLESFFNTDIIFRWIHPGNPLVWKVLYAAYDVEKFVQTMDACVAAAKEISDYPKWLTRPTRQSRSKREAETPVMWEGNGFCLRNPWEPLDNLGLDVPKECRKGGVSKPAF